VGDRIRIYFGNGGPNLTASFHVIGEIFDTVYSEAGTVAQHDVQTTSVPPGGAAIVEFTVDVPGKYVLVDHAIFRAFNKRAIRVPEVGAAKHRELSWGTRADILSEPSNLTMAAPAAPAAATAPAPVDVGEAVFLTVCAACHQPTGQGVAATFP